VIFSAAGCTRSTNIDEEKIRIVLDGLRGETSIAELCRRENAVSETPFQAP
jgi:transposase-like protein